MLRACSRCGQLHNYGAKCPRVKSRKFTSNEETKLRSLASWQRKRESIKERSFYLCAICKEEGDYRAKDIEVHHIIKLRDYPNGLLDDHNLIALCIAHHKQADNGEIDPEYLHKLADTRDGVLGG